MPDKIYMIYIMYYTIVLIIAIVLLIVSLSVIGVMMTSSSNKKAFPDFQNTCPDYWTMQDGGNNPVCYPPATGINTPNPASFAGNKAPGVHSGVTSDSKKITKLELGSSNWMSVCDKSHWATSNNILWDGVSNNNDC